MPIEFIRQIVRRRTENMRHVDRWPNVGRFQIENRITVRHGFLSKCVVLLRRTDPLWTHRQASDRDIQTQLPSQRWNTGQ